MNYNDTGMNVPESLETLLAQQKQLVAGKRHVQMFPMGERELALPNGLFRHVNGRGVFHFRASHIDPAAIDHLSAAGRENEFLNLGPFNKSDIAQRLALGENLLAIAEFDPAGIEVRAAAGTLSTLPEQRDYFEETKEPDSTVLVCDFAHFIMRRMAA